jgi:hypothetical protein
MTIIYEIHNQLTGQLEQAATFEEAKILQERIRAEYIASIEGLFQITTLVQNEDGSWAQSLADAYGQPISVSDSAST